MRYSTKKVVISVIFMLCFFLAACGNVEQGRGGVVEGRYFLLLNDNETISINTYEDNKINELQTFVISESSLFATDQEERVAILHADKNIVIIYEFQTSQKVELSIPYKIKPISMLLNGDNLFIGGVMYEGLGEEMLVQYHIQSGKWYRLEIPNFLLRWGKAVDDLVVCDSFLIAIDNIVMPKYLLFYHLNSTGKLEFSHYKELKSNGAWETIRQGRITSDYLGLLSSTQSGWRGSFEHITILDIVDLTRTFAISIETVGFSLEEMNQIQESDWPNFYTINDFLLVGDKVFFAHRTKGLGVFEIDDSYFNFKSDPEDSWYAHFNPRVDSDKINYIQIRNGEIIRLTPIPDESKFVITTINTQGRIRHEIFEVYP